MSTAKKLLIPIVIVVAALAIAVFISIRHDPRSLNSEPSVRQTPSEKNTRKIDASRFARRIPKAVTKTPKEKASNAAEDEAEEMTVPEEVPTVQSSDDEIRAFLAWLSSLDEEDVLDDTDNDSSNTDDSEANYDYDKEEQLIASVIYEKWQTGYETRDIEQYMSSIWEDDFFYTSDIGTPDDPSDDVIFRGGQRERESAAMIFDNYTKNIELNLIPRSDTVFLSDTIAEAEYSYEIELSKPPSQESPFETMYASGSMIIVLERRETPGRTNEWRILEWYDFAEK